MFNSSKFGRDPVLALDYGTSNSLGALITAEGACSLLPLDPHNENDPTVLSSLLYTPKKGQWFFGREAFSAYHEFDTEGRFMRSLKRFLPRAHFTGTQVHDKKILLEELISMFLRHIREKASDYLQQDIKRIYVGRPALFSTKEQEDILAQDRLQKALEMAGFTETKCCPEPLAAVSGLVNNQDESQEKLFLMIDLGGGTSDFCLVKMKEGDLKKENILAIHGLPKAGDVYDGILMKNYLLEDFGQKIKYSLPMGGSELSLPKSLLNKLCIPAEVPLLKDSKYQKQIEEAAHYSGNAKEFQRLLTLVEENLGYMLFRHIENSKIELSRKDSSKFYFKHYEFELDKIFERQKFEEYSNELSSSILNAVKETLNIAQIRPEDIDHVCITGGTGKIPAIKKGLEGIFPSHKIFQHKNFHAVVEGLAIYGRNFFE